MLSNEEYLESKNLKLYTTVDNIEQNIITDPKLIPNGLHNANNNLVNKNNSNAIEEETEEILSPEASLIQEGEDVENVEDVNEINKKVDEMVAQNDKVTTYASKLLSDLTKNSNPNNSVMKKNNTENLIKKSKNNSNLEIMKVFPLSLIILLIIFIILLIVCIGTN